MEDLSNPHPEEIAQVKEALNNNDTAAATAKIKWCLDKQDNIPLNIAITGESGAGKSSFVNAFRDMGDEDEGAAPTGVTQTTSEVAEYHHPNYPNVTLWDVPRVRTPHFEEYLKLVGFERFDFFIIISDTRFRENDVKLAQEIQRMKKKFYFVRSKIDKDLRAAERSQREFSAEKILEHIRTNSIQSLQKQGFQSPQVFLVSSFDFHLYDFTVLHETFRKELPELKREALLFATSNMNLEIINKKKKTFKRRLYLLAFLSAAVAAVPVPGLSVAVDLSLMFTSLLKYVVGFGLDKPSLKRLAASSDVPYTELCNVIRSPLAAKQIDKYFIMKVLMTAAAKEASRFIPKCGILAAVSLSFITPYSFLKTFLNVFADDAQRVFERALGLSTSE